MSLDLRHHTHTLSVLALNDAVARLSSDFHGIHVFNLTLSSHEYATNQPDLRKQSDHERNRLERRVFQSICLLSLMHLRLSPSIEKS